MKISTLWSITAHVRTVAQKRFELTEVCLSTPTCMLLPNLWKLFCCFGISKRIDDPHQIVAQVHYLIQNGMVSDKMIWLIDGKLLPQVKQASVRLRNNSLAVHDTH